MNDNELNESINFIPYYNGFKGEIIQTEPTKYISNGKYSIDDIIKNFLLEHGQMITIFGGCIDKKQYGIKIMTYLLILMFVLRQ